MTTGFPEYRKKGASPSPYAERVTGLSSEPETFVIVRLPNVSPRRNRMLSPAVSCA